MYTDELLEAKWAAQRALVEKAEAAGKPYVEFVEEEARRICAEWGLTLHFVQPERRLPTDADDPEADIQ